MFKKNKNRILKNMFKLMYVKFEVEDKEKNVGCLN